MSDLDSRLRAAGYRRITEAEERWIEDNTEPINEQCASRPDPGTWWEGREPDGGYVAMYVVPVGWTVPEDGEETP